MVYRLQSCTISKSYRQLNRTVLLITYLKRKLTLGFEKHQKRLLKFNQTHYFRHNFFVLEINLNFWDRIRCFAVVLHCVET